MLLCFIYFFLQGLALLVTGPGLVESHLNLNLMVTKHTRGRENIHSWEPKFLGFLVEDFKLHLIILCGLSELKLKQILPPSPTTSL